MDNISKKIIDAFQNHIDDSAIKKISLNIDINELYEKYMSGEELNELEKYFIMPLMNNDEEMEALIDGNEKLEKVYREVVSKYNDDVIRYICNLKLECDDLCKEIFESKYMLSTDKLYELAFKIGSNDCLINIIENLENLDYSIEDIEKIIDKKIPNLEEEQEKKED